MGRSPKINIGGTEPQPVQPASYVFADGTKQLYNPETNTYTYQESPQAKETRIAREQQRQRVLMSLSTTDPARVAQLEEFRNTFYNELETLTVKPLERRLLQRGLAGSILGEQVGRTRAEAGTQAILAKESLAAQDRQDKLNQLAALEAGASADYANQMGAASLAQQGVLQNQTLNYGRSNALLNANIAQGQLAGQNRAASLGLAGDIAQGIGNFAFLKSLGKQTTP